MDNKEKLEITKKSFYGIYYFMLFCFTVTFISFLLVKSKESRIILFLEILVTGISSFMYYLFTQNISKYFNKDDISKNIDFTVIDRLRYKGWMITTPIMLIVLCLFLQDATKIIINPYTIIFIIILDYIMLLFGYLGELKFINRLYAMILGFIPFLIIFYIIFMKFIFKRFNLFNYVIFGIYFIIWTGYGISYIFEEKTKNILTNIFDGISKGVVALLLSISKIF
jgi:bacteriorhodopsin